MNHTTHRFTRALAGAVLITGVATAGLGLASAPAVAGPSKPGSPGVDVGFDPQPDPPGTRVGFDPQPDPPGRVTTKRPLNPGVAAGFNPQPEIPIHAGP